MATDTKSPGEKLSVTSKTTLTLKPRAETGVVRQSFSHGRSKAVVVEKVRKRTLGEAKPAEPTPVAPVSTPRRVGVVARGAQAYRGRAPPSRRGDQAQGRRSREEALWGRRSRTRERRARHYAGGRG